jgi:hypothetical protein
MNQFVFLNWENGKRWETSKGWDITKITMKVKVHEYHACSYAAMQSKQARVESQKWDLHCISLCQGLLKVWPCEWKNSEYPKQSARGKIKSNGHTIKINRARTSKTCVRVLVWVLFAWKLESFPFLLKCKCNLPVRPTGPHFPFATMLAICSNVWNVVNTAIFDTFSRDFTMSKTVGKTPQNLLLPSVSVNFRQAFFVLLRGQDWRFWFILRRWRVENRSHDTRSRVTCDMRQNITSINTIHTLPPRRHPW